MATLVSPSARTLIQTIVGPIKFDGRENVSTPGTIGQWQNREFDVVCPQPRAMAPPVFPTPNWK